MASITIRDLPDSAKENLRVLAARAGVPLETYVRLILQSASPAKPPRSLLEVAERHFGKGRGIDMEAPARGSRRPPVELGG